MKNSTWKITTLKDGVSRENAVAAIRNAIYGRGPLAGVPVTGHVAQERTEAVAAAA
jgi:hypothetical protein